MCEQCTAATQNYVGPKGEEVLPGYFLVRATKDGYFMKKDNWGLVRQNDPDYWWQVTPVEDPDFGLTDEQIDALPDDNRYRDFDKAFENLERALCGRTEEMINILKRGRNFCGHPDFENAVGLYKAAEKIGYDPEVHGYRFGCWLCHHIAVFLKTAKIREEQNE